MTLTSKDPASAMARTAFWMGLGSLAALPILTALAFLTKMGVMQPFISLVCPVALAAIVLGILCRKKPAETGRSRRLAISGLIMGAISIGLIILLIAVVMILFLPMLHA